MMRHERSFCVEFVWNSTLRHLSATAPLPIKDVFRAPGIIRFIAGKPCRHSMRLSCQENMVVFLPIRSVQIECKPLIPSC